jgi:ferrochelatase
VIGVVVMSYGTPRSHEDIEAYYTHIRRGRPPTEAQLADLLSRYAAIGGSSPLAERTEAQRARLAGALDAMAPGEFDVVAGYKHAPPFIEDAVEVLAGRVGGAGGRGPVDRVVGLVLAPHYSAAGIGGYLTRLGEAAGARGLAWVGIESWHDETAWLDFQAAAVTEARAGLPDRTKVVFTAHSLPERSLAGDPYAAQLHASAAAIAARAGLAPWAGWGTAWQSAGRTDDRWIGPDILDVIDDLADTGRADGIVVCPQGFTADHLEILYDLDVAARRRAEEGGLVFARTRSINDDPDVFDALADRLARTATAAASTRR